MCEDGEGDVLIDGGVVMGREMEDVFMVMSVFEWWLEMFECEVECVGVSLE